jgi:tellurite resistance protein
MDEDLLRERERIEAFFRQQDRQLIERLRRAAREEETLKDLATRTGLQDPELLTELESLGFTPDTVSLLPLVPVIQVAWADGKVSDAERRTLLQLARAHGIEAGSAADTQLESWLKHPPGNRMFATAGRLIAAMLSGPNADLQNLSADELVEYCQIIASASGGMLGIHRISSAERALLASIASELKGPQ